MAKSMLRTRTRRQEMPTISAAAIAGMLMLAEFAAFALTAGQASMVIRSFIVALPLIVFIARAPVVGIYALTFFIPLELFARIPNEFFSLYKLLGLFTITATVVHVLKGADGLRSQRTGQHKWLFAFIFFTGCSVIWSIEPALSIQAVRRLVSLVIFYFLVIRLVDTRDKLRVLFLVLLVSSIIAACFAIYAYSQGAAVFDTQTDVMVDGQLRASGLSLDANFFAATILTALPICLLMAPCERHPGARALLVTGAIALILGTIYSFSRGGALTLGVVLVLSFAVYLTRLEGRGLLGALGGGVVLLLVALVLMPQNYTSRIQSLGSISGDESLRGRMLYVEYGSEAVRESPLGVGAGSFPVAFRQSSYNQMYTYYDTDQGEKSQGRSAHNMYLEIAVEMGLLGGALFLGLVIFAFYENVRTGRHIREKGDGFLLAANQTVGVALAAFCFAGLFLSAQYEKILWLLLALVPVMKNLGYEGEIFMPDLRKLRRALARHGQEA